MVTVILSACFMQEVSGAFLRTPKDPPESCLACLPLANEILGSDCKEPLCIVKGFVAKRDALKEAWEMTLEEDRADGNRKRSKPEKIASIKRSVDSWIYSCAQDITCDLGPAEALAKQLGMDEDESDRFARLRQPPDVKMEVKAKYGIDLDSKANYENTANAVDLGIDVRGLAVEQKERDDAHDQERERAWGEKINLLQVDAPKAAAASNSTLSSKTAAATNVEADVRDDVVNAYVKQALATKKAAKALAHHNFMMKTNPIYAAEHTDPGDSIRSDLGDFGAAKQGR